MKIDRDRFRMILGAMASLTCTPTGSEVASPARAPANGATAAVSSAPVTVATIPPTASAAPPPEAAKVDVVDAGPVHDGCDNTVGGVGGCDALRISPTCEGRLHECRGLVSRTGGFQPRVAAAIVACVAKQMRDAHTSCPDIRRCIRPAVETVCVEPAAVTQCQDLLHRCTAAKLTPKYSVDQCTRMLSSVTGQDRDDALRALGPSGEGCSAQYALPYYPFGKP